MFIEERHRAILEIIKENSRISIGEIQEKFNVSVDSARRDLRILEEKGLLKRTHGGAIPIKKNGWGGECHDLSARERLQTIKENYLSIAKRAISMIENKDVIYLTSASIGCLIAQNIPPELCCTIVTNSISIADELRKYEYITVIVTGGEMSRNGAFYDAFTIDIINRLRFDKCFITSACISAKFGLSIQKSRNVGLVNSIISNSKVVVGLFPTEKINFESIIQICPANSLDVLITDWNAPEEELTIIQELGVDVIVAEKNS